MNLISLPLEGAFLIEPHTFQDPRGTFSEIFSLEKFHKKTNTQYSFVQDQSHIFQKKALKGLHFQKTKPQGMLIHVSNGSIFNVVVDLRPNLITYGQWYGIQLCHNQKKQLWVPPGIANGFTVLSDTAHVIYKTTDYYYPDDQCSLLWCDTSLNINWPFEDPIVSHEDNLGLSWIEISAEHKLNN